MVLPELLDLGEVEGVLGQVLAELRGALECDMSGPARAALRAGLGRLESLERRVAADAWGPGGDDP